MEKRSAYILGSFGFMCLGILLGAGTSYVPFEYLESKVFPYASLSIFFCMLVIFTIHKGTDTKPAGFRYLSTFYKQGNYKHFFLSILSFPVLSIILGYFVYMLVATLPAYPTKYLADTTEVIPATCIETGRNKTRGSWSLFKLYNGEKWKVSGYGHVCPNTYKVCRLEVATGTLGYYVHGVNCS